MFGPGLCVRNSSPSRKPPPPRPTGESSQPPTRLFCVVRHGMLNKMSVKFGIGWTRFITASEIREGLDWLYDGLRLCARTLHQVQFAI